MELPSKKTLDDIERFGNAFHTQHAIILQMLTESFALAKAYVVIGEETDGNGVTTYRFHPNLAIYTDGEKNKMKEYYIFLKESLARLTELETSDYIPLPDLFNTRIRLDGLIAGVMGDYLKAC